MSKVMEVLLKHGKITQEQYNAAAAKEEAKKVAKENYRMNKSKMTKVELQTILDTLTS